MDPFHRQILVLTPDNGLMASGGHESVVQGEGEELVVRVKMPALLFHQEPGRGQVGGCKFIFLDEPKLVKDLCPGELLLLPVM